MTECIAWWGRMRRDGYGVLAWHGRNLYAHRMVYEECIGPIPDGMVIDHLCRNRGCVNPDHLEVVTVTENNLRGESPAARHFRNNECYRGHPFTVESAYMWEGRRYCRICRAEYALRRKSETRKAAA